MPPRGATSIQENVVPCFTDGGFTAVGSGREVQQRRRRLHRLCRRRSVRRWTRRLSVRRTTTVREMTTQTSKDADHTTIDVMPMGELMLTDEHETNEGTRKCLRPEELPAERAATSSGRLRHPERTYRGRKLQRYVLQQRRNEQRRTGVGKIA